jgi:imidazolonepropionase-like amidohydrolase
MGRSFMRAPPPILAPLLGPAILSAFAVTAARGVTLDGGSAPLALVGGTIHVGPTDEPLQDGVLLIQDGKIVAVGRRALVPVPRAAEVLDCRGLAITAGFWNSHVHFFERKWANAATIPAPELGRQLEEMLTRYGFTSVFDLGSASENTRRIRDRIESGEVPGPRIRSTGAGLVAPHAVPPESVISILGFMAPQAFEIADAAQAAAAARKTLDEGADGIKVHLQPPPSPHPPFPESGIAAAVGEARRSGKPVFLHPHDGVDVLAAARAGVDVVAHTTPRSGPWDEATLATMMDRRVALTPTLSLWKHLLRHDRISKQEQLTHVAVGQLRAWVASGGTVLFGTDVGAVDYDPSTEYGLMAEAGMSLGQILASLTTAPAERFGAPRSGRIAPGFDADLVVLRGDPSRSVRTLAAVQYTLRAGRIIYRAASPATP